jgi:exosortase
MIQGNQGRIDAPAISWAPALPVAALLAAWGALYLPVYIEFAQAAWRREENAHAPFIMAIAAAVAWSAISRPEFCARAKQAGFLSGIASLVCGLALYAAGRLGDATLFVSASQGLVATGVALALFGFAGLRRLWFPLALTSYLVIWPDWTLDLLTWPLKRLASELASGGLYVAGLPVAAAGAVISAGPYQLLVADACAGLNSLIALTAVGAVYLYAIKRRSIAANLLVAASLIPIAIAANVLRVALLVLITYYFGYDAGQSFLHETAGLVMFAAALGLVFAVDGAAALLFERKR